MRLRIEWEGSTFETWAQIAHVRPDDGMGLAFFDTAPAQTDVLRQCGLRNWRKRQGRNEAAAQER